MSRLPIHPGEHLRVDLDELGMSQATLARTLKVPRNRISQIVNGERGITADTALRLAHWMGTTSDSWLNLQTMYELRLAEQESGETIRQDVVPLAHRIA